MSARQKLLVSLFVVLVIFLFYLSFTKSVLASDFPVLESLPLGSSTIDISPTLTWSWTGSCFVTNCFKIQVDNQSDFSSPEKDYSTPNTSYSPQLSISTWYWRVKAKNIDGVWSDWSNTGNFLIVENISPSPSPTSSLSSTATPTPTPSPTPTSTPTINNYDNIFISEYLPYPESGNEWVELYNNNDFEVNLNGWYLDDIADGGSEPKGVSGTISGKNYQQFYLSSAFLNNGGDDVRLLNGEKTEKDKISFESSTKGKSWAKDKNGNWCQVDSSPNSANSDCPSSVTSSSSTSTPTPTPTPKPSPFASPATSFSASSSSKVIATGLSLVLGESVSSTAGAVISPKPKAQAIKSSKASNLLTPVLLILGALGILGAGLSLFWLKRKKMYNE